MAESIIIHFKDADRFELLKCFDSHFDRFDENTWYHPRDNYLVIVTSYKDYDTEYDDDDILILREKLGGDPTISFDFEIRRSRSDEACDLIESFIRKGLMSYNFVVDDMYKMYSNSEIHSANDFLDRYRYKKMAEPPPSHGAQNAGD